VRPLITGRMPRSGKMPVLNNSQAKNQGFFAPQMRLVAAIHVKLGRADGHVGPLGCAKFNLNRHRGWESGPQNTKNFHCLENDSLHRFLKVLGLLYA